MKQTTVICPNCEAEFYVEHEEDKINFCAFCGDDIDTEDTEDEDDDWDEDEEDEDE